MGGGNLDVARPFSTKKIYILCMYYNTGHGREAEWVKTVAPRATSFSKG